MKSDSTKSPIPGGIYLCQVSENVSCAACCGLYNAADCSFAGLSKILSDRSKRFARLPRNADAIVEFGRQVQFRQLQSLPWAGFHHCPFVGLIGDGRRRVGCLLHPLADGNNGTDYRGLSYYGGMACRQYFCPSHRDLPPEIKSAVQRLAGSWYEYGLVITEAVLLAALLAEIEKKLAAPVPLERILDSPDGFQALRKVMFLKIDWPYRPGAVNALCHYFFTDRRYAREPVDYRDCGRRPAGYETIFTELTSGFQSSDDLYSAERRLQILFQQVADAAGGSSL